jgi:hypothetical protein
VASARLMYSSRTGVSSCTAGHGTVDLLPRYLGAPDATKTSSASDRALVIRQAG